MQNSDKSTNLVWLDLEMTGLDVDRDSIIEIATIVTDKELNVLAYGPVIAIKTSDSKLATMSDFVHKMHTDNGLLVRVRESKVSLAEAEQATLDFISQWVNEKSSPLCGNSIGTDRMFLNKYMPKLNSYLHYRNIDVSSLKELNRLWHGVPSYEKQATHLAQGDIKESINELLYYRKHILKI